jgi:methylphosphotriester-DNA--protein-cysteine methyltransferase
MIPRRLDRHVRAHFGHPPKTVLRRSRFLDMAAVLRGLSPAGDGDEALMRFYDASHLNREFRLFLDMPPKRFSKTPTLLFTPGLEVREQRKLADAAAAEATPWSLPGVARAAE